MRYLSIASFNIGLVSANSALHGVGDFNFLLIVWNGYGCSRCHSCAAGVRGFIPDRIESSSSATGSFSSVGALYDGFVIIDGKFMSRCSSVLLGARYSAKENRSPLQIRFLSSPALTHRRQIFPVVLPSAPAVLRLKSRGNQIKEPEGCLSS